jgi:endonuclease/exonuclease/phosphatase family metal-dependent hydrolase
MKAARPKPWATPVAAAAAVALGLQAMRVLFTVLFGVRESRGVGLAAGIAVVVFLAPFGAPVLRRALGARSATGLSIGALAVGALWMQLAHPIELWLAAATTVGALWSWTLLLHASRARSASGGSAFAVGTLIGVGIDTAVHAAFLTWDPLWHAEPAAIATTGALVAVVLASLPATIGAVGSEAGELPFRALAPLSCLGAFMLLQLLLVQNTAFVAARSGISSADASIAIVGGEVAAIVLATRPPAGRGALSIAGGILTAAVLTLTRSDLGWLVVASATLAAAVVGPLLVAVTAGGQGASRPGAWRTAIAVGLGTTGFLVGALAVQLDVVVPLPFPVEAIPVVAAVLLAGGAVHSAPSEGWRATVGVKTSRVLAVATLVTGGAVSVGLAATASTPQPAVTQARTLRVVSWNVHAAVDGSGQLVPDDVAATIASWSPDVVLLQEAVRGWPIAGTIDLAAWLSERLDMPIVWGPAADDGFGNLLLSSVPIDSAEVRRLVYGSGPQHRSAIVVDVAVREAVVRIVATHLESGTVDTRRAQIRTVLSAASGTNLAIVAGDMNLQPSDAPDVAMFRRAGLLSVQDGAGQGDRSTATDPVVAGDRPDWIFLTEGLGVREFAIGSSQASDHLPLFVTVAVPRDPPPADAPARTLSE